VPSAGQETLVDSMVLSYKGLEADKGVLPLGDLLRSLGGWNRFIQAACVSYATRQLIPRAKDGEISAQIRIRVPQPGSFDVLLDIVLPLAVSLTASFTKDWIKDYVREHRRWRREVYDKYIRIKRSLATVEQAAQSLAELAEARGIEPFKRQAVAFLLEVDDSLKLAAFPIGRSASKVEIIDGAGERESEIGRLERQAIYSGFMPPESDQDYVRAKVKFIRINVITGRCLIEFTEPADRFPTGHQSAVITDTQLYEPGDPYTEGLSKKCVVEVWVRPEYRKEDGRVARWQVARNKPEVSMPLLE